MDGAWPGGWNGGHVRGRVPPSPTLAHRVSVRLTPAVPPGHLPPPSGCLQTGPIRGRAAAGLQRYASWHKTQSCYTKAWLPGSPSPPQCGLWMGKGVLQAAGEQQQREQAEAWVLQYNFINTGVFTVHLLLVAVTI